LLETKQLTFGPGALPQAFSVKKQVYNTGAFPQAPFSVKIYVSTPKELSQVVLGGSTQLVNLDHCRRHFFLSIVPLFGMTGWVLACSLQLYYAIMPLFCSNRSNDSTYLPVGEYCLYSLKDLH